MKARKLSSGNWNCRIMIDSKSYSFTHSDRREVMRMASAFAAEHRIRTENPTLLERLRDYVAENAERLSPSTVRSYEGMIRMIAERSPKIGNKRISALTEHDIVEIVRPLRTLKTKRNYVNFIHCATGKGVTTKLYGKASKQVHVPTELEVKGLIALFRDTDMEVPIMLGAYGGLRRGEICALTMSDIDGDFVNVSRAVVRDPLGEWVTKEPKRPPVSAACYSRISSLSASGSAGTSRTCFQIKYRTNSGRNNCGSEYHARTVSTLSDTSTHHTSTPSTSPMPTSWRVVGGHLPPSCSLCIATPSPTMYL